MSTSKPMSDGGKGSVRRNEDNDAYRNNFDNIFRKKETKTTMMNHEERGDLDEDYDEEEEQQGEEQWVCNICGGEMFSEKHWGHGRCEDCDAIQRKVNDDYI